MLQSIVRNKSRSFLLGGSRKAPREDIITDCVFGGLRYFNPETAALATSWLLPKDASPPNQITDVTLWPIRERCEPDAVFEGSSEDGKPYTIIVECKWGNFFLTLQQVENQRRIFAEPALQAGRVLHLLVVQKLSRAEPTILDCGLRGDAYARRLTTWRELATGLLWRDRSVGSEEIHRWAGDVLRVLGEVDQMPFRGWTPPPCVQPLSAETLFYRAKP